MRHVMPKERLSPKEPSDSSGGWVPIAHVFGLWAFAVAQPVLDLIGGEPGFLVAHRLTGFRSPPWRLASPSALRLFWRRRLPSPPCIGAA